MKRAVKAFPVPMIALLAAAACGYALASLRAPAVAQAAESNSLVTPARMIPVAGGGTAIVVDQGNFTYVVDPATAKAVMVRDERGEPVRTR